MSETTILTEYAQKVKMTIMREGDWSGFDMTPELMQELVSSYDPSLLKAPLVIDHIDEGPSFGHVLALELVNDQDDMGEYHIDATLGLTAEGAYLVESGAYPERSVQICNYYPTDGFWYLRHLSLLGAGNPRCLGMGPVVRLDEDSTEAEIYKIAEAINPDRVEELVASFNSVKFIWEQNEEHIRYRVRVPSRFNEKTFKTISFSDEREIAAIVGKLKSKFVPEGADPKALVVQSLLFTKEKWDLAKAKAWVSSHKSNFKEGGIDTMAPDPKEGSAETIAELEARVKTAEDAKVEAEKTASETAAKLDRVNVESAVDTLLAAGKILPAHVEMKIVDAIAAIPADVTVGDKSVRNIVLDCIAHSTSTKSLTSKVGGDKDEAGKKKSSAGGVDNRDLKTLEASGANVAPGTIEVTELARKKIASGVSANIAYIEAKRELEEAAV